MEQTIDRKMYLSIGEFAKASGVSRKNLIYYDQIGVFTPDITLDNGYRYYYYRQLYTIRMIRILKETGMSLEEIKAYSDKRSPEAMIELFEMQHKKVEAKIAKLQQVQQMMEMQVAYAKQVSDIKIGDIRVEHRSKRQPIFVASKQVIKSKTHTESMTRMSTKFYQQAKQEGYDVAFPLGFHQRMKSIDNVISYSFDTVDSAEFYYHVPKSDTYIEAGSYLIGYMNGDFKQLEQFSKSMYKYAIKHQLKVENDIYADYLLNEISVQHSIDIVIRVSIRLKDVDSDAEI
ncbi:MULTISPECIES: MerR family transcriptional regulator [unclassified Breznakia]|uniref:MerR family transcriptional regulator n=1 Tax=unclassified Breznakia TaxID=2623764 RepID=UPI002473B2F0|nr:MULTISPECIES: MerR family transcriptional regulator [unclassified Breznakia]MDH6366615.1 DNA-binding transcriptional MerR regulator [Breznakia sp. PH1-1]MDH6403708.1 DNA-binding transcriptional MerR regulator [Breznakia sp. PF1-11]MDH6411417.1 DNA-binding transcriptional MerR regulator [Breznakia sp. PFB1-11]MDH6413852.1 DNA-binding transcriptional MerR regulator [Breznakia sp. PFB1-14]MDH6416282.1 DNA-binding transcriptional MerR regulator [Breznakia sp. PFB1-4]